MDKIGLLILHVASRGCTNCIGTIKNHLYKARGVIGVHIHGKDVIILYDPVIDPQSIIEESKIAKYYRFAIKENKIVNKETIYKNVRSLRKYMFR